MQESRISTLCRNWGIFLIVASIIQFALPEFFDVYWAVVVLLIGIMTLIFRKNWNLALIGGMFLLVGAYNIIIVLLLQDLYAFLFGGIIQIGIGVFVLNQYHRIEKKEVSDKNKSWFKSHTILSTIFIIVVVLFVLGFFYGFYSSGESSLKEDYEVLSFYCGSSYNHSSVEMKSLGNRQDQLYSGLIYLYEDCPNYEEYFISIIEPTKECFYSFNGEVTKLWYEGIGQDNQYISEDSKRIIEADLDFTLWKFYAGKLYEFELQNGVSEMTIEQMGFSFAYKNYLENGITLSTLYSLVDYEIQNQDSCE